MGTKIESGRMEVFAENIDVNSLIDQVTGTTQPLIDKNGNRLEQVYDGFGRPLQIEQLLGLSGQVERVEKHGPIL